MKLNQKIIIAISFFLFFCFFLSLLFFLFSDYNLSTARYKGDTNSLTKEGFVLLQALGSLVALIGGLSSIILAWKKDKREIMELKVKLQDIEQKLQ